MFVLVVHICASAVPVIASTLSVETENLALNGFIYSVGPAWMISQKESEKKQFFFSVPTEKYLHKTVLLMK